MGKDKNSPASGWPQSTAGKFGNCSHSHSPILPQDFESNSKLKSKVISFLEEVMRDPELLTQERKAAANVIR